LDDSFRRLQGLESPPAASLAAAGKGKNGIVTLTDPNARFRNPGVDRHMRFQCLMGAGRAAPKAKIGENCPNVTSPEAVLTVLA